MLAAALGITVISCQQSPEITDPGDEKALSGPPLFQDMTPSSGVRFSYRNGEEAGHYAIVESLGGGLGLIDYDGDGLLDLVITGGGYFEKTDKELKELPESQRRCKIFGYPCKLYKNLGNFKFKDVTREAGLDQALFFSHGVAVADFDRDGWPDLLVTGYGRLALYRNVKGPKGGRRFVEVTKEVGLLRPDHYWSTSAAWADFDADGWPDLYVCQYVNWSWDNNPKCDGYHAKAKRDVCPPKKYNSVPHALYRNDKGRFVDVTRSAGIRVDRRAEVPKLEEDFRRRLKLAKFTPEVRKKLEGDPGEDLSKVMENLQELLEKDRLAKKEGKKERVLSDKDREVLEQLEELRKEIERAKNDDFGKGLGVIAVDFNGDGRPDIFVANDTTPDFLYLNRSKPGQLRFDDVGQEMCVHLNDQAAATGSMGVDAGDYDGSGWPSLWITCYEGELHSLFRNVRKKDRHTFYYSTQEAGIAAIGQRHVGFGTGFIDIDNDGWEDLVIANGHVIKHPAYPSKLRQKPVLFKNLGKGRFQDITSQGGDYFQIGHRSRGLAIGDLDNDGLPDLVISHVGSGNEEEPVTILRNISPAGNHWLGVKLKAPQHGDVVGARLILEVNGRKLTRFAKGGGSYLSARDTRHLFGLGTAVKAGKLAVEWPSGQPRVEHWENLGIDRYHVLEQGKGSRE